MPSTASVVVLLVAFAITFVLARVIAKWFRGKGAKREQEKDRAGESRQVRRARERRGR